MKTLLLCAGAGLALLNGCVLPPPPPLVSVQEPAPVIYQPGYTVTTLPRGYRTVRHNRSVYYVHRNVYYRPARHGYVVVPRPY